MQNSVLKILLAAVVAALLTGSGFVIAQKGYARIEDIQSHSPWTKERGTITAKILRNEEANERTENSVKELVRSNQDLILQLNILITKLENK